MKLQKLRLKNWAGHREKDLTFEGNIIGFTGKNGAGKSTLLVAIDYALRGALPPKRIASNYIRDYGLPGGAKSAEVEAQFQRQSGSFNIERVLAVKGSERVLTLENGNTYKYAEQVDEQIGNILGTDVATLANIIYIPQGDLKNILFGTAAEQERMLVKILDIGYLQDVYKAVSAKISALQLRLDPMIKDRINQVKEDIANLESIVASVNKEIDNLPKIDRDILRSCDSTLQMLQILDTEFRNKNMEAIRAKEKLVAMNANNEITTIQNKLLLDSGSSDVKGVIMNMENKLNSLKGIISSCVIHLRNLAEDAAKYEKTLASTSPEIIESLSEYLKINPADNVSLENISQYYTDRDITIPKLTKDAQEQSSRIIEIKEQIAVSRENWSRLNAEINALALYDHADVCGDLNCSVCGSLVPEEIVKRNKDKVNQLKQEKAQAEVNGKALAESLKAAETLKVTSDLELNKAMGSQSISLAAVQFIESNVIIKEYLGNINRIVSFYRSNQNGLALTQDNIAKAIVSLNKAAEMWELKELTGIDQIAQFDDYVTRTIAKTVEEIDSLKSNALTGVTDEERKAIESYNKLQESIKLMENATAQVAGQIRAAEESLHADIGKFPLDLSDIPQMIDRVRAVHEVCEKEDFHRRNLAVNQAMLQQKQNDLSKLEKQKEEAKPIMDVIDELNVLKDAFSREGIPQTYVTAKFENLIQATKENLSKLNVQFEIRQDEDNPLRFQFRRHDTESSNWLSQDLMSGGQRVRLCLAFIMAVQQVLVPNLGFIILDEPSNHVDETGVDDLRDFLMRIRPELEAADMQLIICDHKETLSSAYTTSIKL